VIAPHVPVLLDEITDAFSRIKEGLVVDCTLGYGGHSEAILKANPNIHLLGCDRDSEAIAFSAERLAPFKERASVVHAPFSDIFSHVNPLHVKGVLADIGVSSLQLDKKERGFGFDSQVLDMRMDAGAKLSAYDVVNHYSKEELGAVLREYGEVKQWQTIAEKICLAREKAPIESGKALAGVIGASKAHGRSVSVATLVFQAIRIEVNDELGQLNALLGAIEKAPLSDCLVGIVSFHSLEDRIVKRTFKLWKQGCICDTFADRCTCGGGHSLGKIITKKPIEPSLSEIKRNPRARSSKLRLFYMRGKTHHE
jgi:16S rRNA (cytosine1402-N4)-methyltransferase